MRYSDRITHSARPGKYFFLLVLFSLLSAITAFGQSKEEKKMRVQAVKALRAERFAAAQEIYKDLLKLDPNNPDYNYEMGLAILEEGMHKGDAAPYMERAIQNTVQDTLPDMFLYAGKSEQYGGNFDLAIQYYEQYLKFMDRDGYERNELEEDVERYVQMCQNGKVQFENNKNFIRIENLGKNINSTYADYSPVVTNDESIILFTSRRENSTGGNKDVDDKYFEDIYYSKADGSEYTPASNLDSTNRIINSEINTEFHDATITYAGDESQLFIYRDLDVWVSKLENDYWTVPTKAQGRINSENGFEPSVFITQDEQTMFVVSDIASGMGGRDIYVTTKDEAGQWKPLSNLGKAINTKFDEDAPFLTPDGNTLYFASTGHNSVGDYDIFKSVLDENHEWLAAENLGPPINTPGHDRYFVTSDDGAVGYYASDRDGGYGQTDIYRIILDCKAVSATIISGRVFSQDKGKPTAALITIFNPETNNIINTYSADSVTGKYEMRLKTETTYGFKIDANGYLPHAGEFMVPQQCEYFTLFQEITIDNLEDSNGQVYAQRASINNAFFDVDQKIADNFEAEGEYSEEEKDSLRSYIAANYNPIELTNFVKLIDIIDPNGIRLSSEAIGYEPVSRIQTNDEIAASYDAKIKSADKQFYSDHLPEARANYMIASDIRPYEEYPKKQIEIIENKLSDAPFAAQLSTMPEADKAKLMVPTLIDTTSTAKKDAIVATDEPSIMDMESYDNELDFTVKEIEYASEQGYTQPQLFRMTPEQIKRLFAKDINLKYSEEKTPDMEVVSNQLSLTLDEEYDNGLSFTDEAVVIAEEKGYTQPQLYSMRPDDLKRLFAKDGKLNYKEGNTTIGKQTETKQFNAIMEAYTITEKEEYDSELNFTEAEIAYAQDEGYTQPQLFKMSAEELKRLFAKDINLVYTAVAVAKTEIDAEPEKVAEPEKTVEPAKVPVKTPAKTIVFRNILFDFDKSDLRRESITELNKVKSYMERETKVEVQIDGHADWIGSVEYNMALSERRAKTAHDYLINKGVSDNRVTYQYFGEAVPIAPNANPDKSDNPAGRQLNRRCEFKIDETGTADNVVLKF